MGEFFVYILKSAACLSVFYLFYRLLLSRETFHRFNRFAVLGILVLSLLIPFCKVSVEQQGEIQLTVLSVEQLLLLVDHAEQTPSAQTAEGHVIWIQIVLLVYVAGITFFVLRHIYSLIRLSLLLKSGRREKSDYQTTLITHNRDGISPFSWMKYVVISEKDRTENEREILIHEFAHIRNHHSIDLLLADICIVFQWFNPAAWLLKQELQNIHEYEADQTVIKAGINAKDYQLLIIKKAVGTRLYSMANSFNHSKLKKRITMMLKEKSNSWTKLRYLYVLPLTVLAVSAFARPDVSNGLKDISEAKVNDLTAIVVANADENQRVKQETTLRDDKTDRLEQVPVVGKRQIAVDVLKIHEKQDGKNPLVVVDGKEMSQADFKVLAPERIKTITILKDKRATAQYGEKGADGVIIIALYSDEELAATQQNVEEDAKNKMSDRFLVLVDGVEVSSIDDMIPENVAEIKVYKLADIESKNSPEITAYIEKYGEKAKKGVVNIVSKKEMPLSDAGVRIYRSSKSDKTVQVEGTVVDSDNKPVVGALVRIEGTPTGTVTDAEGKFVMNCAQKEKLTVSYIDMKSESVQVAPKVTVTLEKE